MHIPWPPLPVSCGPLQLSTSTYLPLLPGWPTSSHLPACYCLSGLPRPTYLPATACLTCLVPPTCLLLPAPVRPHLPACYCLLLSAPVRPHLPACYCLLSGPTYLPATACSSQAPPTCLCLSLLLSGLRSCSCPPAPTSSFCSLCTWSWAGPRSQQVNALHSSHEHHALGVADDLEGGAAFCSLWPNPLALGRADACRVFKPLALGRAEPEPVPLPPLQPLPLPIALPPLPLPLSLPPAMGARRGVCGVHASTHAD